MTAGLRFALLAALLPLSVFAAGCGSDGPDEGPDMNFFRAPDPESSKKPAIEDKISLLFPTGKERVWKLSVRARTSKSDTKSEEIVRVGAPQTIGGVANATTLTMYQNGKPYRKEIYRIKKDSLELVAAGGDDKMVMSPPMKLLSANSPQGQEEKWEGSITFKGAKAPGQAFSRVREAEEVVTPAGKFPAYRVDTSLTTVIEGRPVSFPASRWFVPGVGIVKQSFRVGDAIVEKELMSYTGS